MPEIRLVKLAGPTIPKSMYYIELEYMHGDADKYEKNPIKCRSKEHFFDLIKILKERPDRSAAGGRKAWSLWCRNNEIFNVPGDCTCDGEVLADISNFELFWYDEHGEKWGVAVEN